MTLLLDLAIRSAILVLAGLAVAAVLRRQAAALRHAVLAMTVIAAAGLLPLTAIVPTWHLPLRLSIAGMAAPQALGGSSPAADAPPATALTPSPISPDRPTAERGAVVTRPAFSLVELARLVWVAGFAACAGVLLTGFVRLARIGRRARPLRDGELVRVASQLQAAYRLRRPVRLLQTDAPDVLATFGVWQHRVLLPVHANTWSAQRIHAVLSHELAHVGRQDWLVQMTGEALRCVYWFNPLLWIACARLRCESEYACDDVVVGRGIAPREYAVHLLELARVCRHPRRLAAPAIPMAGASALERRVTVMLNPAVNHTSVSRRARVAAAALLACLSVSVAAARAGQSPQHAPSRSVTHAASVVTGAAPALPAIKAVAPTSTSRPSGRVASSVHATSRAAIGTVPEASAIGPGAQSAAPLVGSVYDVSGGVLPGVKVTLRDAREAMLDNQMPFVSHPGAASTAMTDAAGRFQFPSVAPGTYSLEAAIPGFRTLRQNIELRNVQDWDRVITLQVGQLSETVVVSAPRGAAPAGTSQAQPTRIKVGGNIRAPRKLVNVNPLYPDSMRDAGREAAVSLDAVIGTDGSVTSVRVISADIHPDFAIAAAEAVRQWKFDPTLLNGVPVEVQMTVTVEFRLTQ